MRAKEREGGRKAGKGRGVGEKGDIGVRVKML